MGFQHQVPAELWIRIFRLLPAQYDSHNDVQSVRLVCRHFEQLASHLLMSTVRCGPISDSLVRLTAISLHPIISKSIQEVVYTCYRYESFKTLQDYEHRGRDMRRPQTVEDVEELNSAFLQYRRHYDDQIAMEITGEATTRLCTALMRMTNIEIFTLSPDYDCTLNDYCHSPYFCRTQPDYDEVFTRIAHILSLTGIKLREFHVDKEEWTTHDDHGLREYSFSSLSRRSLHQYCDLFRGLREVTLTLQGDGWTTDHLVQILSCATELVYLHVAGILFGENIDAACFWRDATWSQLSTLRLEHVSFKAGVLFELLSRHSTTLRELQLRNVMLFDDKWRLIFETTRDLLRLESLHVYDLRETDVDERTTTVIRNWDDANQVEAYCLRDGPLPLLPNVSE